MARKYGFTRERDVRRAMKTSRLVLDRRVVEPAKFGGRTVPRTSITTINNSGGSCACGTRYARGSQTITLNSVDYEAATTLTITPVCFTGTWPFPEATFDTDHWETGAEVIEDCYTGDIQGEITIVPFYETTGSIGGTGYDVVQAWVILTNTANTCEDESGNTSPDIEAKWLCREFRPLGPTCEAELIAGSEGNYALPKKLCIAPKAPTADCGGFAFPETLFFEITSPVILGGTYSGTATGSNCYWSGDIIVGGLTLNVCITATQLGSDFRFELTHSFETETTYTWTDRSALIAGSQALEDIWGGGIVLNESISGAGCISKASPQGEGTSKLIYGLV